MPDAPDRLLQPEPAGGTPAPEAAAALPETAKALAAKARDLEAIRAAVVDAASVGAGLWLSYLFALFYLLIAAGGVTHKDLFLESPVKLPFLNVDLPLKGFFVLGPALFLIVHAYVLLHFVMLADKVRMFDNELRAQIDPEQPESDMRTRLRRQLPSNIFVQFLAGPSDLRQGLVGGLLQLIAWISLVIGPVALLVFFQLQFLPYHAEWITWWQRIAVALDLALLYPLWPAIVRSEPVGFAWRGEASASITVIALACIGVTAIPLVFAIATFPGEWLEQALQPVAPTPLRAALVAGEVDFATRKPESWWSNRLVLPGFDIIDHTKLDTEDKIGALPETVSLRARHLESAVLIGAILRKADFTAALLQNASLDQSDLRGAKFECAETVIPRDCAQLQGASLDDARLQGASLDGAGLQGASLVRAQLQGASLVAAQLQGASLDFAQLQGALLDGAQLQGALLDDAQLQGASLVDARLQGASLYRAQLQGASLDGAELQSASLVRARLQGASLDHAQLQGALLGRAQLQGALLGGAQLQGASLDRAFVWRADPEAANTEGLWADHVQPDPRECELLGPECDWNAASLRRLKRMIEQALPKGDARSRILAGLDERLDPDRPVAEEAELRQRWLALQARSPPQAVYAQARAAQWREIGCAADGAPFVLTGLVRTLPLLAQTSSQVPRLAAAFLDPACAGARGMSAETRTTLEALRDRDKKQPPATPADPAP